MNILQTVLKAVELPAGVAHLDSSLANMNTDALSLQIRNKVNHNFIFVLLSLWSSPLPHISYIVAGECIARSAGCYT